MSEFSGTLNREDAVIIFADLMKPIASFASPNNYKTNQTQEWKLLSTPASFCNGLGLCVNVHPSHVRFVVALDHAQELPAIPLIKAGMVGN